MTKTNEQTLFRLCLRQEAYRHTQVSKVYKPGASNTSNTYFLGMSYFDPLAGLGVPLGRSETW